MNILKFCSNPARFSISFSFTILTLNLATQGTGQDGGSFYELLSGDANKDKNMMVMKKFHHCSLKDDCLYVLKNVKFKSYKTIKSDKELQEELKNKAENKLVWKKIKIKRTNELMSKYFSAFANRNSKPCNPTTVMSCL